jgi:5-methylcytosine-specific restriction endonuclease McrA
LVIACPECNHAKSNRLPIEFKRYRLKHLGADSTYRLGSAVSFFED